MTTILDRRGTAAAWAAANTLLAAGEEGFETDTGKYKKGDGVTLWNDLPYYLPETMVVPKIDGAIAMLKLPYTDVNMARPDAPDHVRFDWTGPYNGLPPAAIDGDEWTYQP